MSEYADTSFLVSLYVSDSNSEESALRMEGSPLPVLLTRFGELELANAMQLRLFRREASAPQLRNAYRAFRSDINTGVFSIEQLPDTIYSDSLRLVSKWTSRLGTRTLDIIHVASALFLKADVFNTFDARQRILARAVGLRTP